MLPVQLDVNTIFVKEPSRNQKSKNWEEKGIENANDVKQGIESTMRHWNKNLRSRLSSKFLFVFIYLSHFFDLTTDFCSRLAGRKREYWNFCLSCYMFQQLNVYKYKWLYGNWL